jgi:hypothetical protein
MTQQETEILLNGVAKIGAAVLAGTTPATAATYALGAIIREVPHLFAIATIVLAKGELTAAQRAEAHALSVALGNPASIPPASATA